MPRLRYAWVVVICALMVLAKPASGNEILLTFSGGVGSFANSDVHNGGGFYMATYPGSSELQMLCCTQTDPQGAGELHYVFPEVKIPPGDKILSATLNLSFPSELQYSYEPEITEILPAPDPNQPSVPGRVLATVKTTIGDVAVAGCYFPASVTGFDLLTCDPTLQELTLNADSATYLYPSVISAGFNSAESFSVHGENVGDVNADIVIVYGAVPEPSSLVLLGTGVMVLTLLMKRRIHRV
jgi:PEP-CTERM motif